ncbi:MULTISPECIES: D-alanyl-D-alanine carboxypeptidase [unclassified Streptomyces]|uniref:D-alanyl-D-alanine carboxypeptidase n=1 Tax=unclassified Streptomyces TaxID=2593676 RepID=UPI00081BA290|nr:MULTISPECIES: D-alanyl-D-alanine carboxypeptidase [unclassified Streptomyces]SCD32773.1 D-alanyl-D-alanine carboxypeptidase [Streptomyces sp. PalvLS-984]SDE13296.1 D-alanyl-D-alanine carboxypeptidase [Streptomyces sp. AmelKG-A3]
MAGESPDRSKQRKSSGTASGTAEERDPRLAVFREPAASASTGSTAGAATAVFRTQRPTDTDDDASDAPASGTADAGTGDEGGGAADGAVKDAGRPEKASAPRGGDGEAEDAEGGSGANGAPSAERDADSDTDADAGEAETAGTGPADTEAAEPAGPARNGSARNGSESEDSETKAGETKAGETKGPETKARETGDGEAKGRGPKDEGATVSEAEAPESEAPESDKPRSETASAEPESGSGSGRAAGSGGTKESAPAPRVPKTREEVGTEEVGTENADTEKTDTEQAGTEEAPASREEKPASDRAERTSDKTDAEPSDSEPSDTSGDGRGIDQPTAVFTTTRRPQVDQPTTALKLPPRAADTKSAAEAGPKTGPAKDTKGPKDTKATKGPKGAEGSKDTRDAEGTDAPAERTSKFVPLRSDDVRPAPVPSREPGAPGASGATGVFGAPTGAVGPTVVQDVGAAGSTGLAPGYVEAERTRQQPMPPKPPLDLLAELTNTPPPPETPVRTAVRRVKIWTPLVLLLLIIFAIAQAVRPLPDPALTLSAAPTYTFGGEKLAMPWPEEGQGAVEVEGVGAIGSYGKEKSAPIASMAKVMTAYVILKDHPITGKQTGERIEVDAQAGKEADSTDESMATIKEGDTYTEYQMLQMLMIPSGNNVARLLARWDAETEEAFVEKMNAAAKDLGMTKSTYTDPSGLKSSTVSTPADQIKLGKAVMQNDIFRRIVDMPQADIPGVGRIYNNNDILLEPGVNGIKTGSSTPAGGNLLWTASTVVDGKTQRIIGVVMGADMEGRLYDKLQRAVQNSLKLIQAAQKGVDSATVVKKGQVVGYVDNGFGAHTPVVATKNLKAVGWSGLEVDLKLTDGGKTPGHQAEAGTVVGEVTIGTGTGKVSAPVALQGAMTEPSFGDKLTRIS